MEDNKLSEKEETKPSTESEEQPDTAELRPETEEDLAEEADTESGEQATREISQTELPRIVEALLFATDEPLAIQKIKSILPNKIDVRKIKAAIDDINRRLSAEHHPYEIVEVAGGFQFRTVQYYHPWVRQLFREKVSRRLSQSALETLAIIAYKQPLTKAEIEAIRGVMADGAMKTLLERHLIRISGRSDKPGRPLLYETTKDFLRYFGLKHIEDLPKLEEFEQMVKAQNAKEPAPEKNAEIRRVEPSESEAAAEFTAEEQGESQYAETAAEPDAEPEMESEISANEDLILDSDEEQPDNEFADTEQPEEEQGIDFEDSEEEKPA